MSFPILLPVGKLILLISVVMTIIADRFSARILFGYYCIILLFASIFQNVAVTKDYGFAWPLGNTLVQFSVLLYCFYDLLHNKTHIRKEYINRKRLWVAIPMMLAFLMPYSVNMHGVVRPSFTFSVLWNESGFTYCMITPIIIGMMLIYSKGIYKPVMSVISYVGLVFGLLNMMTWFGIQMKTDGWVFYIYPY